MKNDPKFRGSPWIEFVEGSRKPRTRTWFVITRTIDAGQRLGMIRWWSPWRAYVFMPTADKLFDQKCLKKIAEFCEKQTAKQREKWRRPKR